MFEDSSGLGDLSVSAADNDVIFFVCWRLKGLGSQLIFFGRHSLLGSFSSNLWLGLDPDKQYFVASLLAKPN